MTATSFWETAVVAPYAYGIDVNNVAQPLPTAHKSVLLLAHPFGNCAGYGTVDGGSNRFVNIF